MRIAGPLRRAGCSRAAASRLLSNRYLRTVATLSHSVEQRVEWCVAIMCIEAALRGLHATGRLYAFDVHCNAYFPLFIALYGVAGTLRSSQHAR